MKDTKMMEYELTKEGWFVCAAAGLLEELTVFAVLGIELMQTPGIVFLVLWAAFGILSSAFLMGAAYLRDRRNVSAPGRYAAEQVVFSAPAEFYETEQQYGCFPQRKAS